MFPETRYRGILTLAEPHKTIEVHFVWDLRSAERAEKSRWLGHVTTLLVGTQTPLGQRLVEKPTTCNSMDSMGLGLRSGTLRNRVHALRRYFTWLATSHQVTFPETEEHMLDYLELKVQEPYTGVALKVVHQRLLYLEEISEISPAARLTVRPHYSKLLAELVSNQAVRRTTASTKTSRQGP